MIRFILLLPIKIIGAVFILIGSIMEHAEKQRIQAARIEEKRIAAELKEQDRRERAARIATEKAQRTARIEQEKRERKKQQESKKAFQIEQAKTDIVHYEQQRRDLLKLYNEMQSQYDGATGARKETLYRKILALNNQLRAIDRTIERLQFTADRTG